MGRRIAAWAVAIGLWAGLLGWAAEVRGAIKVGFRSLVSRADLDYETPAARRPFGCWRAAGCWFPPRSASAGFGS